ncbi:hypothetical protein GGR51DRAFT_576613 [Nemania sp. FL0031]|nr:hypothetical protein GGR51DRAFT_576613 [Nemania sp. FL0031]
MNSHNHVRSPSSSSPQRRPHFGNRPYSRISLELRRGIIRRFRHHALSSKMSSLSRAFALTDEEKHSILCDIKSLLLRTGSIIERAQQSRLKHDYDEAQSLLNQALLLATDPDACDASQAPLTTCYLYQGHIFIGLGRIAEAFASYTKAANTETRSPTDIPAAGDAARRLLALRGRAEVAARAMREANEEADRRAQAQSTAGGERVMMSGNNGTRLPVTIHRGPERRVRDQIVHPQKRSF